MPPDVQRAFNTTGRTLNRLGQPEARSYLTAWWWGVTVAAPVSGAEESPSSKGQAAR